MPRDLTTKPVALATIACSKLIFEPSAKLVTIAGFCPHFSAKPSCVVGRAIGILQSLDVADDPRRQAEALDPAEQIDLDARLVAVARRQDDAVLRRRTTCRMGPIVASISAFSSTTSLPCANASSSTRAPELDRAGRLDQHVDMLGPRQEHRVLGGDDASGSDRVVERLLRVGDDRFAVPRSGRRRRRAATLRL